MSRLKGSSFFCEDLRMEESGQPMLIGLLSPKFEISGLPTRIRSLNFVSLFYASSKDKDVIVNLEINVSGSSSENKNHSRTYSRRFSDEMVSDIDEEENLLVISLPLHNIEAENGTKVEAKLSYSDVVEIYTLEFCEYEEE